LNDLCKLTEDVILQEQEIIPAPKNRKQASKKKRQETESGNKQYEE